MLSELERNFISYARSFHTGDPAIDHNLQLKLAHTFRVKQEAGHIVEAEHLPPAPARAAIRAALLHDLSRFEQFSRFRSFNDAESFDHGDRSAELVAQQHHLDDFSPDEAQDILAAIRVHNKVAIPPGLSPRAHQLSQIVRDADKLDIIPILLDYLNDPANQSIVFGLSQNQELSPEVLQSLQNNECPRHRDMHTVSDFVIAKLFWVHDLNFPWSRSEFRRRQYLEQLMKFLPSTPIVNQLYQTALARIA